jgi:hypothetical protein
MVYLHSGLPGVYETRFDTRDLLAHETGDALIAGAIGVFYHQVENMIGTFAAAPGKLRQYYNFNNLKSKACLASVSIDLKATGR